MTQKLTPGFALKSIKINPSKLLSSVLAVLVFVSLHAASPKDLSAYKMSGKGFMENKGQIVDQNYHSNLAVKYLLCQAGINVQLRQTGFSYDTYTDTADAVSNERNKALFPTGDKLYESFIRRYHRVDVELVGCNMNAAIEADGKSSSYYTYITAGTPSGGVSGVHYYQTVTYKNIYPNIDLVFMANGKFEYNFVVHPGGNAADIKLQYNGANGMNLANNNITINVTAGSFTENIPSSYMSDTRKPLVVSYKAVGNNTYQFLVPASQISNSKADLIIDPSPNLTWATYYGGTSGDHPLGITYDASGNVYVTGQTASTSAIATAGAAKTTYAGGTWDAFAAKFNSTGTQLLWGTYYGGTGQEWAHQVVLDKSGNVCIAGVTTSSNGIATAGAWKTAFGGSYDIFLAKFKPDGSTLLWGTYYGNSGQQDCTCLSIDGSDNLYIYGYTNSSTGIATAGAHQTTFAGTWDGVVAEFNPSLPAANQLVWGTYYGNSGTTWPGGIALDASNNVFITAQTTSTTGIATAGAYQTTLAGAVNVCIAEFTPSLPAATQLVWATYYGGTASDIGNAIAVDANDNVYVAGQATSTTGIATAGAYQTTYGGGGDAFLAKFNPSAPAATQLVWGTYYGGSGNDLVSLGMALDANANIFIAGQTASAGLSTTGVWQTTYGGGNDGFLAKFSTTGSMTWSTYYGGSGSDVIERIAVDANDNIYATGQTTSSTAIATASEWQNSYAGGGGDGFVAKFSTCNLSSVSMVTSKSALCNGDTTTLAAIPSGSTTIKYAWTALAQKTQTIHVKPYADSTFKVVITDTVGGCAINDSVKVTVSATPTISVTGTNTICSGINTTLTAAATSGASYSWSDGETTSSITVSPTATGTKYVATGTLGTCIAKDSSTITVNTTPTVTVSGTNTICSGVNTTLAVIVTSGSTYSWSDGETSSSITVSPALSGTKYVATGTLGTCISKDSTTVTVNTTPTVMVTGNSTICAGVTTTLTANGGSTSYSWSDGESGSSITVSPAATGTKYVATGTLGTCTSKDSTTITVNPAPAIVVSPANPEICAGGSIPLIASGAGITGNYTWAPTAGLVTPSAASTNGNPASTTTYTVVGQDLSGCKDSTTVTLTVNTNPTVTVTPSLTVCAGNTVNLNATGGSTYNWSSGETSGDISVIPTGTTQYVVTASNGSCSAKDSTTIAVNPAPVNTVSGTTTITIGSSTSLGTNNTSTGNTYSWTNSASLNCSDCSNPVATPTITTTYVLTLTDNSGCSKVDSAVVTVKELCGPVYVPNAFSPNGDGSNDGLKVYGNCIQSLAINIFDRWGNKVYESTNLNAVWDGRCKGQTLNTGTYVYTLSVTDLDNNILNRKGNITLLR